MEPKRTAPRATTTERPSTETQTRQGQWTSAQKLAILAEYESYERGDPRRGERLVILVGPSACRGRVGSSPDDVLRVALPMRPILPACSHAGTPLALGVLHAPKPACRTAKDEPEGAGRRARVLHPDAGAAEEQR